MNTRSRFLFVRQLGLYLLRAWWEQRTYKTAMALGFISSLVGIAQFAFLGWFLQNGGTFPELDRYGGDIAAFMISGTIFTGFVAVALNSFSSTIQREQVMGTLEAINSTRSGIVRVMLFAAIAAFLGTVIGSLVMLLTFGLLLGFELSINIPAVVLTLVLTLAVLGGLGMAGCGVVLVTKKGDPVTWIVTTATTLLSGVLYPVSILPDWLRSVAECLPTTLALEMLRQSLLTGAPWSTLLQASMPLVLWGMATVPLGALAMIWGLRTSRRNGTVTQF